MYCTNCGEQMNDIQDVCLKCGVKKNTTHQYCHHCGEMLSPARKRRQATASATKTNKAAYLPCRDFHGRANSGFKRAYWPQAKSE